MDRALHYLGYQARTVSEIDSYLRRKEFGEAAINVTLRRLQEMGYLDDTAFARNYVMSRMRSTSASRLKMRMDLARRGVDKEIVEDEIRRIPLEYDVEAAKLLARKRWERLSSCDDRVRAQKVMAYLVRRGFSYEVAKSALTRVEDGEDHDD